MATSDFLLRPVHAFHGSKDFYEHSSKLGEFRPPLYDSHLLEALQVSDRKRRLEEEDLRRWSTSRRGERDSGTESMAQQGRTDRNTQEHSIARDADYGSPQYASETRQYSNESSALMPVLTSSASHHVNGGPMSLRNLPPPLPRSHTVTGGSFLSLESMRSSVPRSPIDDDSPRRRKIPETNTASSQYGISALPPMIGAERSRQIPPTLPSLSPSPQPSGLEDGSKRPILIPRSPLQRTESHLILHRNPGIIPAKAHPFPSSPSSDAYMRELNASGIPGTSTPPPGAVAPRPVYGYPPMRPPAAALQAFQRHPSPIYTSNGSHEGSASPTPSFPPFGQVQQTSPGTRYHITSAPMTSGKVPGSPELSTVVGYGVSPSHDVAREPRREMGIPVSTSGSNSTYQMMTIETSSGIVQVPVDVQAASKVADEKRKRNAGASARFRERRKKKEVESTSTITKLENRAKDLAEDVEHYRRERDYLANVVLNGPDGQRHFPRPQSPRLRRVASGRTRTRNSSSATSEYASGQEMSNRDSISERNVRRRTQSFTSDAQVQGPPHMVIHPPQYTQVPMAYQHGSAPQHQPPMPLPPQTYQGSPMPPFLPPQPHGRAGQNVQEPQSYLTHTRGGPTEHPGPSLPPFHTLPPVMQASPTTGPFNPYANQRYDIPRANTGQPPSHREHQA